MKLVRAIFVNRAPFEKMEVAFVENGINVLTAINGKGKTTILSHIVDSFYELAKLYYPNEFEGKENKYYRVSSSMYNVDPGKPSFVYLRFKQDDKHIDYIDVRNVCSESEYNESICIDGKIPFGCFSKRLDKNRNVKYWHIGEDENKLSSAFDNNILTYFPAYRYETPSYLGDSYQFKIDYKIDSDFFGYLNNPIEVRTIVREIANWIMDVVLDWENYKTTHQVKMPNGQIQTFDNTPELNIWRNLNEIVRNTLSAKQYQGTMRLGIGRRSNSGSRISIVSDNNGDITTITPNPFCLSSGELAILCCFGELLRQADKIQPNTTLEKIQGIVLVDEVEKHLHIKLQKEILPKMFKLFPNIQFIVSSHSPFFNMGLADEAIEKKQIIDLDNNGIVCEPTNNDLYNEVYRMMVSENQRFADKYKELENRLKDINKPVVITEGKTDVKHILKAKEILKIEDLDFETIDEETQPDGDKNLEALLQQLARIKRPNKIIGIFDHDNDKIYPVIEANGQTRKDYGNGVYAFCIPVPETRKERGQNKISIEYLYSDEEIKSVLENGCRLFFGTEFSVRTGLFIGEEKYVLCNQSDRGADKIVENNGGQAVYDSSEKNHLAKKNDFAEAVKNDKINISDDSWNHFIPIFDSIRCIIQEG